MSSDSVQIRVIRFGSSDYEASLVLRNEVLRLPLGLQLSDIDKASDQTDILLGAFIGSRLVGCLQLRQNSLSQVQMRQVSVESGLRGHGIGRKLVAAFEREAHSLNAQEIVMDARLSAREFYESLGYSVLSEVFVQSTIPHLKMRKRLYSAKSE